MTLRAVFLCCGMSYSGDFPGGLDGKASVYNVGAWVRSLGREDPLEKEMAIHSSTIAWKTPWTEEPSRLQSMGLQRVGNNCAISLSFPFLSCSGTCWPLGGAWFQCRYGGV